MCTAPVVITLVVLGFLYGAAILGVFVFIALPRLLANWIGFRLVSALRRIPARALRPRVRGRPPIVRRPVPTRYTPSYGAPRNRV